LQRALDSLLPAAPLRLENRLFNTNELVKHPKLELKNKFTQLDKKSKNSWISKACDVSVATLVTELYSSVLNNE